VTYNGNGNTGGSVPVDPASYQQGQIVTILDNTGSLVKTGDSFGGWNTAAGGSGTAYTAGQTFTMGTANVTLYAQWPVTTNLGFAYTVNQYDYTVSQLTMGPTGALTALTPASLPCEVDPNSLAVDPSGKYLYVVNLKGATGNSYGSISQYTIGTDGSLAPMTPSAIAEGGLFTDIAVHPSGKWAYAPNSRNPNATVSQYAIGPNGALTAASTTSLPAVFPQFLVIDPSGKHLYVAVQGQVNGVAQFNIDQTTGALTAMTPASVNAAAGATAFGITVHPSGKYLYLTDYFGTISEYTIDSGTGALSPLAQTKVDGAVQFAAWITVDPSGKYAYVANAGDQSTAISQYTVGADGSLNAMSPASVAATSAATNVQVDASGKYLYMTSGTSGQGSTVTQFAIGPNGALSPLNTTTVGFGPNAIVLVKH
jgi:6-phosphogluconolactonase (cycloisomerase 2 family)